VIEAHGALDVRHSLASIAKAREHIGYIPEVNLEEGLSRTIEHFRERLRVPAHERLSTAV
jgi:nucleoside-diphosphate-sugar epimerase